MEEARQDLTLPEALEISVCLVNVPGVRQEQLEFIARDVARLCRPQSYRGEVWTSERQAEWLIDEIYEHWEHWRGPAVMRQIFTGRFVAGDDPEFEAKTKRAASPNQQPHAITDHRREQPDCARCHDYGILSHAGVWEWCNCDHAAQLRRDCPRFLEMYKPARRPPDQPRAIEAEIERAIEAKTHGAEIPLDRRRAIEAEIERAVAAKGKGAGDGDE